ncbi:MAG: hypothetical protein KDD70_09760 [Bdellovibrionales bacterium]|nr:hypothetical protein [Bdellovibrionales bacterium]
MPTEPADAGAPSDRILLRTCSFLNQRLLPSVIAASLVPSVIAASLVMAISGCAGKHPVRGPKIDPSQVEYLDRAAVAREEVATHPTRFLVGTEQRGAVWKRVEMLGKTFINTRSSAKVLKELSDTGFHVRHFPNRSEGSFAEREGVNTSPGTAVTTLPRRFAYEVIASIPERTSRAQKPSTDDLQIEVFVVNLNSGEQDKEALLLAHNIARFLKTGILERSLL